MEVPQFMQNDLKSLNLDQDSGDGLLGFSGTKITIEGRIRKSIYYIIARGIKFGLDTGYLIKECMLTQKVIKDLGIQSENKFMF